MVVYSDKADPAVALQINRRELVIVALFKFRPFPTLITLYLIRMDNGDERIRHPMKNTPAVVEEGAVEVTCLSSTQLKRST